MSDLISLIYAIPNIETQAAVDALREAALVAVRTVENRLDDAEAEIEQLRVLVVSLQIEIQQLRR